jgi:hypothetical protein
VRRSTSSAIPLIIIISSICSITFLWYKMCFIYFYLTLEKIYWLFKVYLLEFDIGRLRKIWIQQGRRESKKFGQLWVTGFWSYLTRHFSCSKISSLVSCLVNFIFN